MPSNLDSGHDVSQHVPARNWPTWVSFAVWGLRRRTTVLFFVWLSVLLAIATLWLGIWPGVVYFGCALWYWAAVRWIDRHADWPLRRMRAGAPIKRSALAS